MSMDVGVIAKFTTPIQDAGPCMALLLTALPGLYAPVGRFSCSGDREAPREWSDYRIAWREVEQVLVATGRTMPLGRFLVDCDATMNPPELVEQKRIGVRIVVDHGMPAGDFSYLKVRLRRLDVRVIEVEIMP